MTVTYRHGLSILELIIYLPSFFVTCFLTYRHGLRRNSGFFFLATFTLSRIVGACCDLVAIDHYTLGLYIAAAVCMAIGLSPLMLALSGLLSRANLSIQRKTGQAPLNQLIFIFFRLLTLVAMVLSIVGITANMSAEGLAHPDIKVKVGMTLYLVAAGVLCLLLAFLGMHQVSMQRGEKRTILAVAISTPFLLVRLIYATLIWFLHDSSFSMIGGNVTIQLVMSVLEEFAIVITCIGVGITLRVVSKESRATQETHLDVYSPQHKS
ncbi:hypothetical protein N7532_007937 [Penicillium argentinense]|uniref:DUF7702 domain-containing protein n=1 Tax=Penicillium argentinense TaxID=1131581 RepID=A0A9W9EWD1_9EURO|nr:uncharacterized protein N7532_007937 [Penicillium argentinense]KAJ5089253.1 hypothetical protein N7532_007937 [Penicillium argentinense]